MFKVPTEKITVFSIVDTAREVQKDSNSDTGMGNKEQRANQQRSIVIGASGATADG